ncbi:Uncharacterised protein [Bordetella pertussis]|nr:Uncharacterised protein [Bordetella pertussis]
MAEGGRRRDAGAGGQRGQGLQQAREDVGRRHHDEGGHLARRQRQRLAVGALQHQPRGATAFARQDALHELGARHGAEQVHPLLGFFAEVLAQGGALALTVEQRQVHVLVAVHAVEQTQQAHFARLVPQRQRAIDAQQMVLERAGLVPVFAGAARKQQFQQGGQVGVDGRVMIGQQGAGVGMQVSRGRHDRYGARQNRYCRPWRPVR